MDKRCLIATARVAYAAIFYVIGTTISSFGQGSEPNPLTIDEVLFDLDRADPKGLLQVKDNLYISGNTSYFSAWVAKVDNQGQVIWSREIPRIEKTSWWAAAVLSGIAEMPDASLFSCGTMPRTSNSSGLLIHFDSSGRMLDQRLLNPSSASLESIDIAQMGSAGFDGCIAANDGIAIIGFENNLLKVPSGVGLGVSASFLWVLMTDQIGQPRWERSIEVPFRAVRSKFQIFSNKSRLFIAAADDCKTYLFAINNDGKIEAQRTLEGRFTLAQDLTHNDAIYLFGRISRPSNELLYFKLDDALSELERGQISQRGFYPHSVYRLDDGSFVLFGREDEFLNNRDISLHANSSILYVNELTQKPELLYPPRMSRDIELTAPTDSHNGFVTIRFLNVRTFAFDFITKR